MHIRRTGMLLFTQHYTRCVTFYREAIGLPVLFSDESLTCFDFGGAYLMVEPDGVAGPPEKTRGENPFVLRFNVEDVDASAQVLRQRGVDISVAHYDWGMIAEFADPDGNRCELKDHNAQFSVFDPTPS